MTLRSFLKPRYQCGTAGPIKFIALGYSDAGKSYYLGSIMNPHQSLDNSQNTSSEFSHSVVDCLDNNSRNSIGEYNIGQGGNDNNTLD